MPRPIIPILLLMTCAGLTAAAESVAIPQGPVALGATTSKPTAPAKAKADAAASAEFARYFGPQRDWPRFRGPMGNGVTAEKGLPVKWSRTENVLWSTDLFQLPRDVYPIYPFTSPIVSKDKVFVMLASYKLSVFADPPGNLRLKVPARFGDLVDVRLVCYRKSDGGKLWETPMEAAPDWRPFPLPGDHGGEVSCDVSTPCTDGERVYVAFGGGGALAAVDYKGKVVWRQELSKLVKGSCEYCPSTSPVLYGNQVIMVLAVGDGGGATVAFDCKTGELKYSVPRPDPSSGVTQGRHRLGANSPVPALLKGAPALLYNGVGAIEGINPDNGKMVWFATQQGGGASLAVGGGMVFADFACTKWEGSAFSIDLLATASGDITGKTKWRPPDFRGCNGDLGELSSPVIADGFLYRVVGGKVFCFEVASGKLMYNEPLPDVNWIASPFASGDGLVYFTSSAKSFVIKGGPKFELVATSDLSDGDFSAAFLHNWRDRSNPNPYAFSSAAVSEGKIFILGSNKLWCIGR